MSNAKRNVEEIIEEINKKLPPEESKSMKQALDDEVKLSLLDNPSFWSNLFAKKDYLGELYFNIVNRDLYEKEQNQASSQATSIHRRTVGFVTISSIIDQLHSSDLDLPKDKRLLRRSPATLKRRVDAALVNLGLSKRLAKDENGHYSFPEEWTSAIEIFCIELSRDHSYLNKVVDSRYDEISILEAIEFFETVADYIQGKMDEDRQQVCLRVLDEAMKYQVLVHIHNIQQAFQTAITAISELPYPVQIGALKHLFEETMEPWAQGIIDVAVKQPTLDELIQIATEEHS